eukprot:XP_011446928.1 PREDICTED: nectin-1-like isoform X4 [Crassostrea gigas]
MTMQTKDVYISQRDNRIVLNCTYNKDIGERIPEGNIRWQKKIGNTFQDIAIFSPPNLQQPFIIKEMDQIYNNRTELIVPNTSMAAVMIINNPVCKDGGIYRCLIKYFSDKSEKNQTSGSVVKFIAEAKEPEEIVVFPEKLDENQSLSLTCSADVGSPQGYIQILKFFENSDRLDLIYKSNSTINKTENCTEYINVTATYTVTREDNGAVFRCSSRNGLTQGPGPTRESNKISVLYGPDETTISLTPNKSMYTVGDRLTIQCITDSNPPSTINLYFRPNGSSVERPMGLTDNKLEFDSLQVTDSGTYTCTAVNEVGSNSPNATTRVTVSVKRYYGCSQCRYIDTCQQNYDEIECILNKWVPTAVVFMTLSVAFAVSSIVLYINRKRSQETIAVKTMHNTRPHPSDAPEDNGGGYASPSDLNRTQEAVSSPMENICEAYSQSKDFIKLQEHSLLITHHNEPDGYTTTQDVVQYAAVQKKPTKDQVSDENVYDSAWNSDNVFFKLRPDTQGPHRSPEQQ